jgi:cellulose synthase/poly-beta-1,6-N-acetylglucosamine synthase-like glycosyltransferase
MTGQKPSISVVVPTRNRPEFVGYCLQSLRSQTFTDFEVIVCDNHTGRPCRHVFDQYSDERFHYVTPPTPLAMHDNWEYACELARGEYVAVLIDKTALHPSALETLQQNVQRQPAEIVSWWNESYYLNDESVSLTVGRYAPGFAPVTPHYFDPRDELARRYQMDVRRGLEGIHYYRGKICFGAYHQRLIERVKGKVGRLFWPIAPDYTSMVCALSFASNALDLGRASVMSFSTVLSNGSRTGQQPALALQFLLEIDPSKTLLNKLPIQGLYSSQHNIVAYDYGDMKERIGAPLEEFSLNQVNLLVRVREDMDTQVVWSDAHLKEEHYKIWSSYYDRLSATEKEDYQRSVIRAHRGSVRRQRIVRIKELLRGVLQHLPDQHAKRIRRIVTGAGNRPSRAAAEYPSIVDALNHADAYYNTVQHAS